MRNRRAPAPGFRRGIRPIFNKRSAREDAPYNLALHADAFTVNEAHGAKACAAGLKQVLFDDALNITRRDGVQVEDITNLYRDREREGIKRIDLALVCGFLILGCREAHVMWPGIYPSSQPVRKSHYKRKKSSPQRHRGHGESIEQALVISVPPLCPLCLRW
jgi:hypothetical protein